MPFVKLDCKILDSSIWSDRDAREIFVTALLMARPYTLAKSMPQIAVRTLDPTGWEVPAGEYGFVNAAGIGIVKRAGFEDIEAGLDALERLGSPENESGSISFDGRRLVRIDGGYVALNYMRYRDKDSTNADRQRRHRERRNVTRYGVTETRNITQAEAEAEAEEKKKKRKRAAEPPFVPPTLEELQEYAKEKGYVMDCERFWNFYESKGWMVGRNKMKSWRACMANWAKGDNGQQGDGSPGPGWVQMPDGTWAKPRDIWAPQQQQEVEA